MTSDGDVQRYQLRFDGASDLDNDDYSYRGDPVIVGQELMIEGQGPWVVSAINTSAEGALTLHLSRPAE